MKIGAFVLICAFLAVLPAASARDRAKAMQFRHENMCPSTGQLYGRCPGFVVDHIVPLCAGGADAAENMQWQEQGESREKDRAEQEMCRWIRKARENPWPSNSSQ